MNLADYMLRQFACNDWANREMLATIRSQAADERSLQLMAHILAAERLWLERMKRQPQSLSVWPKFDLAKCDAQALEMAKLWRDFLDQRGDDLLQRISYKNTEDAEWTNTVLDIMSHVVTHSAYHRGQIASHMRESGQTPVCTDFIHAIRQGLVE